MSKISLSQTQIQLPNFIKWTGQEAFPKKSLENAVLAGITSIRETIRHLFR